MSDSHMEKPVENSIKQKLTEALQPSILEVINESYMHSVPKGSFNLDQSKIFLCGNGLRINHYRPTPVTSAISSGGANMTTGMSEVTKGSETHFKAVVVTEKFDQLPLIKRHRMVNQLLDEELKAGVHALSITAKTPKQWEDSGGKIGKSPPCRGGAGL